MWAYESVFYQIYPLGLTGAPFENDGILTHRLQTIEAWIPHLKKLGIGCVTFSPLFESDSHGYNTRDYRKIDQRLGTNEDFMHLCNALQQSGIRVVLDGVFNHVGRGFFAFQDVKQNREASPYKDWFHISFDGNSNYNDGFWYEGWEGHYDLVKLNLQNEEVIRYLLDSVKFWIDTFQIDGLRLDVAYLVDQNFLRRLRAETSAWKEDFFLYGEMIGGDYNTLMKDDLCHSVTNYECYKGMYSSLNSMNLFEIVHSLIRQFGSDPWCLYRGRHLYSFVDNHDVSRIASVLTVPEHLPLVYALMFGIPGIPSIYYGSEWGFCANKSEGDPALRPAFDHPEWNDLTGYIANLADIYHQNLPLQSGDFASLHLTNRQCVFVRNLNGERILIAINADAQDYTAHFDVGCSAAKDLISGETVRFDGGLQMKAYSAMYLKPCDID
jgi:cyclomaltodextrinase